MSVHGVIELGFPPFGSTELGTEVCFGPKCAKSYSLDSVLPLVDQSCAHRLIPPRLLKLLCSFVLLHFQHCHKMSTDTTPEGSSRRPQLSPFLVTSLIRDLYGLHVQSCRELDSFEDRNFHVEVDVTNFLNAHLREVCCHGYVLKVLNSEYAKKQGVIGELL